MEFTVCAKIEGIVYATIFANSIKEAVEIAKNSYVDNWDSEEWMSSPTPISIMNPKTKKVIKIEEKNSQLPTH